MIHYSTNWMGPVRREWTMDGKTYQGSDWAGGRIDVSGDVEPYTELGLRLMRREDWYRFTHWLDSFTTETLWTTEQLVEEYEKTNPKIRWCYDD